MIKKTGFILMGILALLIGVYPLLYAFVEEKYTLLGSKAPEILHNTIWKTAFVAHIVFGGTALFIGWRQFGSSFRNKYMSVHRVIGKMYVIAVVISSVCSIYLGFYANGGMVAATGFIILGIIWLVTTIIALISIKNGSVSRHQQWMTYSYACTFAAVTLRIWLLLLRNITGDAEGSYMVVAWLCWVPNLLAAYFINRKLVEE